MELEVSPNVRNFILSLRNIGYSLDTAVADIVDNSITARATMIKIYATSSPKTIAILDNGSGMSSEELLNALKLGSKSPIDCRDEKDLGRFGLGLKTASFSQCKKLTVFSVKDAKLCGYYWDLDYISQKNSWLLQDADISNYIGFEWYDDFLSLRCGTVVIWENIDRFDTSDYDIALHNMCDHLSMVFHRFIDGEISKSKIAIFFNNKILESFNPFPKNKFTQEKLTETQFINGEKVSITPFILPHHSKVSKDEYDYYATKDGYQKNQGFYLYREGRLLIWGTWFGLHKQCEAHKLVRIKIDINNKLDDLWKIDVKKSIASPAPQIRSCLKRIIREITEQGFRVYQQRGRVLKDKNLVRYWDTKHSDGKIKYIINREHPSYVLMKNIMNEESFTLLESYLKYIEEYIPIDSIMAKMMDSPKDVCQKDQLITEEKIMEEILSMEKMGFSKAVILNIFNNNEAFVNHKDIVEKCLSKVGNNE